MFESQPADTAAHASLKWTASIVRVASCHMTSSKRKMLNLQLCFRLFWGDKETDAIYLVDKDTGKDRLTVIEGVTSVIGITVFTLPSQGERIDPERLVL